MALGSGEANAVNTLIHWAAGRAVTPDTMCRVTDEGATEAARRLAGAAVRALNGGGLHPEQVRLSATRTLRERLVQLRAQQDIPLSVPEVTAVNGVLDLLDRIERAGFSAEAGQ